MTLLKIGLIGCGAIGSTLAHAVADGTVPEARMTVVFDINREQAERLSKELAPSPSIANDFAELLANPEVNLVLEASSQRAAWEYVPKALSAGKNVLMMSVGAFSDGSFAKDVEEIARRKGVKVFLPSGAVGGLDCIKAAAIAGLSRVTLVTRKPPKALAGARGTQGVDLGSLTEPRVVYSGRAREAIGLFPQNVNVAAAISMAGIGLDSTEVKVIADPTITKNIHEVTAEGNFGKMTLRIENEPSPDNPKTSHLAALSAIRKLMNLNSVIELGT